MSTTTQAHDDDDAGSAAGPRKRTLTLSFSERTLMLLLCLTNLVNYVDRGIVPGASGDFDDFIAGSLEAIPHVSTAFGALASVFIVGFSLGAVCVGHLAHTQPPFKMAAFGLVAWCVAAVAAGLARRANSYVMLLVARACSGLGEAGFVTVGGPFIQDASKKSPGAWLGLYFAAIPTGTALGYGYGAAVAAAFHWSLAFYLEALVMLPLALCFYASANDGSSIVKPQRRESSDDAWAHGEGHFHRPGGAPPTTTTAAATAGRHHPLAVVVDADFVGDAFEEDDDDDASQEEPGHHHHHHHHHHQQQQHPHESPPTVWDELGACLRSPAFPFAALGYAGYAGAIIGFSTFGPSIAVGLGLFSSVTGASVAFSASLALAGIVGTPFGGVLLDRWSRRRARTGVSQLTAALEVACVCNASGCATIAGAAFATSKAGFLGSLAAGCLPLFAATTAMNLAVFESVPRTNRAFGVALGTLIMHAFGDVPTPIIVGSLKDLLAPACTPASDGRLGDDCPQQRPMLRVVTICCDLWLGWSLLGFSIALYLSQALPKNRHLRLAEEPIESPLIASDGGDAQIAPRRNAALRRSPTNSDTT